MPTNTLEKMKLPVAREIIKEWEALELNPKQLRFLAEYVVNGFNARQAYIKAGYTAKSTNSIDVCAYGVLSNAKVRSGFQKWKEKYLYAIKEKLEPELLNTYWRRANYQIETFQDENGQWLPMKDIPEEWKCCVDGYEEKFYGKDANKRVIVLKLADRNRSLEKLDKYINMIKEMTMQEVSFSRETMEKLNKIFEGVDNAKE